MRGVDRQRRQHRKHRFEKMLFQPGLLFAVQAVGADVLDAFLPQKTGENGETFLLVFLQALDLDQQLFQLLLRRAPVRALDRDAFPDLSGKTRHPHHEELVQIGRGNRQEAHPFEQGMAGILQFLQDPAVELQPGELAIDEPVGISRRRLGFGRGLAYKFIPGRLEFGHLCSSATGGCLKIPS